MENETGTFTVTDQEAGQRLDKVLAARFANYSRTYFQKLIQDHLVLVNGELVKKRTALEEGDEIEIEFALTPEISLEPENIPLDILYEDEHLIAVNKPPGMVVHPAVGNWSGTFVNALLYHCKKLPQTAQLRPGIVHRLDKETSGVLIAAKTEKAHIKLVAAFAKREVEKHYVAICIGNPGNQLIEGNIGRHPQRRKEMTVLQEKGKPARTRCQTERHNAYLSYVHLFPETGRTHQLRVHLKAINHPILGDSTYGNLGWNKKYKAKRQLLHAYELSFIHPITDKKMTLKAPIPQDIQSFVEAL